MNVDELLSLERPLTDEEAAFMEQELLKLAKRLEAEGAAITAEVAPEHQAEVNRLVNATARTVESIEAAIAIPFDSAEPEHLNGSDC